MYHKNLDLYDMATVLLLLVVSCYSCSFVHILQVSVEILS